MKLLVINGPNLNLLGVREPDIYGREDFAALCDFIRASAAEVGAEVAAPLNVISRFILGVTPLESGFRRISVSPQLGGLRRVDARVPTAMGAVVMSVSNGSLTLETPAPTQVVWGGKTHSVNAGKHVFEE